MRARVPGALVLAAGLAACIDDPSTTSPIAIAPSATSVAADGSTLVTLTVSAATDGDVTLTASSGAFVDAPVPAAGAPATRTVKTARGSTSVSYRAGLDIGTAVITASAGSFTASTSIALTASLPTQIALTPSRTSVVGDGASFVELQTDVLAVRPALVSHGTALRFEVCCTTVDGAAIKCPGAVPLSVPSVVRLPDQQLAVRAVAVHAAAATSAILVAWLDDAKLTGSLCRAAATAEVRSNEIAVSIAAP